MTASYQHIGMLFQPRPAQGLAQAAVGGEILLTSQPHQPCHLLNATATMVWQRFDGQSTLESIVEELERGFDTHRATIATDVVELTRRLGRLGFIDNVTGPDVLEPAAVPFDVEVGDFELPDLTGQLRRWSSFRGRQVLLINWNPDCGHCLHIAPQLGELRDPLRRRGIELVLVTSGAAEYNRSALEAVGLSGVVGLCRQDTADPFAGLGTPAAVLYTKEGGAAAPLAYGASAVADLALNVAGGESATAPGPPAPYGTAGTGVCAPASISVADNTAGLRSSGIATYRLGQLLVGVGFNSSETEVVLDRMFPAARIDDLSAPPSCAIALHPSGNSRGSRRLNLFVHSGRQMVRSRSSSRVLRALIGCVSTELYQPDLRLLQADAIGVVRDGDAYLLPSILYQEWALVQPRLNHLGFQIVDLPRVDLDPVAAELVVNGPRIPHDVGVINELDRVAQPGSELPAVPPGRYPLRRWVIAADHPPGPLTTARSVALTMALITWVPALQAVLDELVTLFSHTRGYRVPIDPARMLDQLPRLLPM